MSESIALVSVAIPIRERLNDLSRRPRLGALSVDLQWDKRYKRLDYHLIGRGSKIKAQNLNVTLNKDLITLRVEDLLLSEPKSKMPLESKISLFPFPKGQFCVRKSFGSAKMKSLILRKLHLTLNYTLNASTIRFFHFKRDQKVPRVTSSDQMI